MARIHFQPESVSSGGGAVDSVSGTLPIVITGTAADPVVTLPSLSGSLLDANSVTVGKLETIATNRFLGRTTAATGDVEILTAAQAVGIIVDEGADGPGSGLDADTLDGQEATEFFTKAVDDTDDITEGIVNFFYTDARVGTYLLGRPAITTLEDVDEFNVNDASTTPSLITWANLKSEITAELLGTNLDHGSLGGLTDDDHSQYHTDARALTWLGTRSTTDLPEGTNLYYTQARFDSAFSAKSTTDLSEGTNLYYTDARVGTYLLGRATFATLEDVDEFVVNDNSATPSLITWANLKSEILVEMLTLAPVLQTGATYTPAWSAIRRRLIRWTGSGTATLNLPAASDASGSWFEIRNERTGAVTIDPSGAETIDGQATRTVRPAGGSFRVWSNGTSWFTVGRFLAATTANFGTIKLATSATINTGTANDEAMTPLAWAGSADKATLDAVATTYLPLAGGTMTGVIDMGGSHIDNLGFIRDSNDNEIVDFTGVASAAHYLNITNAVSGGINNGPILAANGPGSVINFFINSKGVGSITYFDYGIRVFANGFTWDSSGDFTSAYRVGEVGETYTVDYTNLFTLEALATKGTWELGQSGQAFGSGFLFNAQHTLKNENATALSFGPQYLLNAAVTYTADGAAVDFQSTFPSLSLLFGLYDQNTLNVINSGTLNCETWVTVAAAGSIGAGVTVTNRVAFQANFPAVSGTLDNAIGYWFTSAYVATNNYAILVNGDNNTFPGGNWVMWSQDAAPVGLGDGTDASEVILDTNIQLVEQAGTPSSPTSGTEANIYLKGDNLVIQFNDGGTVRYKYLNLTGTGVTWTHSTTAP